MQINNCFSRWWKSNHDGFCNGGFARCESSSLPSVLSSSAVGGIQDVFLETLSQLKDYALYVSFQNPSIPFSKIVHGTLQITVGMSCIIKSQLSDQVVRWLNPSEKSFNQKNNEADTQQLEEFECVGQVIDCLEKNSKHHNSLTTSGKQKIDPLNYKKVALFAVGTFATLFGIYYLTEGLYECFILDDKRIRHRIFISADKICSSSNVSSCIKKDPEQIPIKHSIPVMNAPSLLPQQPTVCALDEEIVSIHQIYEDILGCPSSVSVLEEIRVRGEGKISLKDLGNTQKIYDNFYGRWDINKRTVYVNDALCHRNKLSVVLYEILNANRTKDIGCIEAMGSEIGREQYTQAKEAIGFDNKVSHHRIVQACMTTNGWNRGTDTFAAIVEYFKNFEDYWKAVESSPHANLDRKFWDDNYRVEYCKENEQAKECTESLPKYILSSHLTFNGVEEKEMLSKNQHKDEL